MRRLLGLIVILTLTACATLPPAARVSGFGDAVATTATAVKAAFAANSALNDRIEDEMRTASLIRGQAEAPVSRNELDRDEVARRIKALSALENYGKALAAAADQGKINQLEKAADGLVVSAVAIASAAGAGPVAAPAGKLVSRAVGLAISARYAAQIHSVIVRVDPTIQELSRLLRDELSGISLQLKSQATEYAALRRTTLILISRDARVDSARIRSEALAYSADVKAANELARTAAKAGPTLDAMAKAHAALARNEPDATASLVMFLELAGDLPPLITALRTDSN